MGTKSWDLLRRGPTFLTRTFKFLALSKKHRSLVSNKHFDIGSFHKFI